MNVMTSSGDVPIMMVLMMSMKRRADTRANLRGHISNTNKHKHKKVYETHTGPRAETSAAATRRVDARRNWFVLYNKCTTHPRAETKHKNSVSETPLLVFVVGHDTILAARNHQHTECAGARA